MISVRDKVDPCIGWKIGKGDCNFWWDNWGGKGALAEHLGRGSCAADRLSDYLENQRLQID